MGRSCSTRTGSDRSQQLRLAKRIWGRLRPDEKLSAGRSVKGQLSFSSLDRIAPEIAFQTQIEATEIGDALIRLAPVLNIPFGVEVPGLRKGDISIRVRGALYDEHALQLASQAADREITDLPFLDFDVYAVHCQLEGKPVSPWPHAARDDFEHKLEQILELYSAMLAQIWSYFGGRGRAAFERMTLWMLGNGLGQSGPANLFGAVFAAGQYGDKILALRLLDGVAAAWDHRVRVDPDNGLAQQIRSEVLESVSRARRMLAA